MKGDGGRGDQKELLRHLQGWKDEVRLMTSGGI